MISKVILTRDELCELVALVLRYNKKKATEFRFVTAEDGETIMRDFSVEVSCEADGIKVRDVPEDDETHGILFAEMDKATRMFEEWRKQRPKTRKAETIGL